MNFRLCLVVPFDVTNKCAVNNSQRKRNQWIFFQFFFFGLFGFCHRVFLFEFWSCFFFAFLFSCVDFLFLFFFLLLLLYIGSNVLTFVTTDAHSHPFSFNMWYEFDQSFRTKIHQPTKPKSIARLKWSLSITSTLFGVLLFFFLIISTPFFEMLISLVLSFDLTVRQLTLLIR